MTINILSGFANETAAALIAGASLDLINPHNAPADFLIPNEQSIRAAITQ